jgi:hypothetical protein
MFHRNESPLVMRVHAFDLYQFDYDDGGEGHWYHQLGGLMPATVTLADRYRIGVMPIPTFELSLDWLQMVVANDALIEFDLLNQTQAALVTHDYALAVVAGWTICELRLRALAPQLSTRTSMWQVVRTLRDQGLLSDVRADQIDALRRHRNTWLHDGGEPEESVAVSIALRAAELLRVIVPDLIIRPPISLIKL